MQQRFSGSILLALVIFVVLTTLPAQSAEDYNVDAAHSGVTFKVSHLGLSWIHGRFNEYAGTFTIDATDPSKSSFNLSVKAESIDTNNQKRDGHLRSPDFFNVKQFPSITLRSTSVKAIKEGFQVTGEFTMHGVTKPVSFEMLGGRKAEFPKGVHRTGYSTELTLKRSEYGIDKFGEAVGDNVYISISFEGTKK
jgi:polyisoprenoid-binding protein YceI